MSTLHTPASAVANKDAEPQLSLHVEDDTPPPGDVIRQCTEQLHEISNFQGDVSDRAIRILLRRVSEAYADGRDRGGDAYKDAIEAHQNVWAASLQANYALAIHSLTKLDNIEYDSINPAARYDTVAQEFNRNLEAVVSANSKLRAGEHIITYNTEDISMRITEHMRRVLIVSPNHRFPQSIAVDSLL